MSQEISGNTYGNLNVRSSSNWGPGTSVEFSTLDYNKGNDTAGIASASWCARVNDTNQWVSLSALEPVEFVGVKTQGRGDNYDQWVTSYRIRYTLDGATWFDGPTFNGNTDKTTIVTNRFATPIVARTIAIHPLTWNTHISMRFDAIFKTIARVQVGTVTHSTPISSEVTYQIAFPQAYPVGVIPQIITQIQQVDTNNNHCLSVFVGSRNITNTGFSFVFQGNANSLINSITGTWTAVAGPTYF
ncbi:discoidin I [Heterostelium album PN500]|uniref:Discoidin I n=1 Tax=Heterostelium pallidum (strain ATCC 26659 / Pp 5 / PN500) TaxID=670386 RepID=D3BEL6_HETP5|nr:discoidin I [Heterostelium album PN500]EFA80347.1 discoidin I [Heterostelium album PN500]|eukprot:XP_020432467.1 discoidin I [Heterostelium album PN500]